MRFILLLIACLTPLGHLAAQHDSATANDAAQFLAGLPLRGTTLDSLGRDESWMNHATEFDHAWRDLDKRQLSRIREWAPLQLKGAYESRAPLFYMFSGPDFLYAQALFPNAATYVLCGLEPIGPLPDVQKFPREALDPSLVNLRKSLNSVLNFSFFITKDMKVDLKNTQLSGTLPVLYVFLARAGCRIERTEFVNLAKDGTFAQTKAATSGVRIVFFGPAGREQTLYYFNADLSNGGLKSNPAVSAFCQRLGDGACLLKAASYLMHTEEFSMIRAFLLARGETIVQDDSGIPIRFFDPAGWNVQPHGSYPGPIELFQQYMQPDLSMLYRHAFPQKLTFGFGYRWTPAESTLLVARRRTGEIPVAVPAPSVSPSRISPP